MATESPLIHDGGQVTLSSTATISDGRRSSITGSTLGGPNGSGQFLAVLLSTIVDRTVVFASSAPTGVVGAPTVYGILQNTPGPGQPADVGLFGISKVVAASTSVTRGGLISPSTGTTQNGRVDAYSTGTLSYVPIGVALEQPSTVGSVISAFIYPMFKGSTA